MENRTITETKIYYLSLSDMRGWADHAEPIAAFDTMGKLEIWLKSQEGKWTDEILNEKVGEITTYKKAYRKETPLEWYRKPESMDPTEHPRLGGFVGFQWVRMETLKLKIPLNPEPCTQ